MLRAIRALTYVPPPLLFIAALVLGFQLNRVYPQPVAPLSLARFTTDAGVGLIALGAFFALSAVALFIRRRTTIVPHHRSRVLVTRGPFRFTRNPMYVALSCAFMGISLVTNSAWALTFLTLPLIYLHVITIPREERLLREVFGTEYDSYASRVRRWL